ncbi:hypothetical protein [Mycolicibacterium sp.]|uniref:hypothetical protein n=1 Tax=Mycolicibacterium sp. TaxID=2320850 RepID=UPI0028A6F599|nr:hypothetical protein [Mycolicibacterium sp.]
MSVIGYLRRCAKCEIQMLVTVDYKHADLCPECLDERLSDVLYTMGEDDHIPPWQVHG